MKHVDENTVNKICHKQWSTLLVIYIFWESKASYVPHKVTEVIQVNRSDDDDGDDDNNDYDRDDGTICFQAADTVKIITSTLTTYLLKLMASERYMWNSG